MKKLHSKVKKFIVSHYWLTGFLTSILFLLSCIIAIRSATVNINFLNSLAAIPFATSLATLFRLFTYRKGKIALFMKDTSWYYYRRNYTEEEAQNLYKEKSLNEATTLFLLMIASFIISSLFWVPLFIYGLGRGG